MQRGLKRIGLLDHMGTGNLGDDATQTAVIQNIRTRWPGVEVVGLSMNPADTRKRHGISAHALRRSTWGSSPIRGQFSLGADADESGKSVTSLGKSAKSALRKYRFLFGVMRLLKLLAITVPRECLPEILFLGRSFKLVKSLDLLLISGGGQLLDCWDGPWGFPYTIYKWIVLAKMARVKRVFLNVGAGPLDHRLSRFFVKRALRSADYISFRDRKSKSLIQQIGFNGRSEVVADNVYGLEILPSGLGNNKKVGNSTVGISPMAYCDPRAYWKKDQGVYDGLIRKLAIFAAALIGSGYRVVLFTSDIRFDRQTIPELQRAIESGIDVAQRSWVTAQPVDTTEEFLAKMSSMDYVVTCRFHGVVFAHLVNKPVLAISHHPKVATLMDDIGLGEYCLDINNLDPNSAFKKFTLLVRNAEKVKNRMADTAARYKLELTNQFDDLFPCESTRGYLGHPTLK